MKTKLFGIGMVLFCISITPLLVQGEDLDIWYVLEPREIPSTVNLRQEFRFHFLLDWAGNEAAIALYNQTTQTTVRVNLNITLSEGLMWLWQSQTQQLRFWVSIEDFHHVPHLITEKYAVKAIKTGFQTISIDGIPEIGQPFHQEFGLWVRPEPPISVVVMLKEAWPFSLFLSLILGFFIGYGYRVYEKYERRE